MYNYGREKALELRAEASTLTDTEIIDREDFIPHWHEGVQILDAPIQYEGQVYRVIQAHDSASNPDWNPANSPALFSICHTKNPLKAKPWATPLGTSGMYYNHDCYIDGEGNIWRQIYDAGNIYDAATLPERWEKIDLNNFIENNNNNNESEESEITELEIPSEPEVINDNDQENNEIIDEWVQPTGAHNAYPIGAKVSYNNKYWINTAPANIYTPGVYGWDEIE